MSRSFIIGVLVFTTALAGFAATPSRAADPDDVARALGIAATLFIIGKALDDHSNSAARVTQHRPRISTRNAHVPRIVPRETRRTEARRAVLPRVCAQQVSAGAGTRAVMTRECLRKKYRFTSSLPGACALSVRGRYGNLRNAFSVRCLRRRGYVLS